MIEKQEFYHGAALYKIVEDPRFSIIKYHNGGFATEDTFIMFKYRTKTKSPWRFHLQANEIECLDNEAAKFPRITLAFICGGDGICGVLWQELWPLLDYENAWVSIRRNFNGQYSVSASKGELDRKIPQKRWPGILFANSEVINGS